MDAAHAEPAGECRDQGGEDSKSNQHNDQQGEACEQYGRGRLQDRVDHSGDCMKKDHLAIGR